MQVLQDGAPVARRMPARESTSLTGDRNWIEVIFWPQFADDGQWIGVMIQAQSIAAEQTARAKQRRAESLLDAIVENIPSSIVVQEGDTGKTIRVNRAAEAFVGVPRERWVGRGEKYSDTAASESHFAKVAEAEAGGGVVLNEEVVPNGRGEPRVVQVTRMIIADDEGAKHVLTIAQDLTEIREAEQSLRAAAAEANAANRAKSEFLANMSHEIRTPLNGVMGIASALARTSLAPGQAEMVGLIETSAKALEALLSDILDLARIEAGRLELKAETFDLATSVNACAALFSAAAEAKGLDYHVTVEPNAEGAYIGDAPRVRQILSNLLGNAVKFTHSGSIGLHVSAVRGETASALRFEVRDTGIGFDAETKARLFGRFEQADGSITRRFGGTGLGLAISRSLAEAIGGTLEAESEPGHGASFVLTLELPRGVSKAELWGEAETLTQPEAELEGFKVLVAEDHPTNRRVVELILGALDLELVCVENGAEAVEAATRERFDLILMDMQMPVMDGLAAIRAIRALEARTGRGPTPIYALTANAMPEHIAASSAAGANGHLAKPITADVLIATVEAVANGEVDPLFPLNAATG
jgi:PAS domain S-box-containing protein